MRQPHPHSPAARIRIWDLPTRLFHWLTAGSFAVAWLTHAQDRQLDIHVFAGYLFLALLLFRLWWGLAGSRYARFRHFACGWSCLRGYLRQLRRGQAQRHLGHNPAGGWAIFLMLALGLGIGFSGLLLFGAEERHGPFAGWLSFAQADALHVGHEGLAWALLLLVCVHITGVLVESRLQGENLVGAMFSGHKRAAPGHHSVAARSLIGLLLLSGATVSGLVYFRGYYLPTGNQAYRPYQGPALADDPVWREACGECHLAYHPSLLPARSWQRLLATPADHFGDDLALDAETRARIETFLTAHAAEQQATEAAWKIGRSIPADQTPLRITATPYWQRKHAAIAARYWDSPQVGGKADCGACHLDAEPGTFEDAAMRLPVSPTLPEENP